MQNDEIAVTVCASSPEQRFRVNNSSELVIKDKYTFFFLKDAQTDRHMQSKIMPLEAFI